jgi:hypothetical protein
MAMLSFGGIDVSKDRLDMTLLPDEQCSSVSNDAAGWAELVEQLCSSSITAIGAQRHASRWHDLGRPLQRSAQCVDRTVAVALSDLARAQRGGAKRQP